MEYSESSISNTISKLTAGEELSMYQASLDDEAGRLAEGIRHASISNEGIRPGNTLLDTYEVMSEAINGGMGSVWRVHHKNWDTDLALKRPQPKYFAEGSEKRKGDFIRECENWIDLGLHPNIVSCYYVRDISGVPGIFSEWMENGSLKDRIRDGALYEGTDAEVQQRILDIAVQALRGLRYSHQNGLIHQDVKPGNILLTKDWEAKLADFGLAKAGSQIAEGDRLLSSGYTREYCPAEQAERKAAEVWMDVYAWALTVLEMYAGQRLWASGAEAKDSLHTYFDMCRIPVRDELRSLLAEAVGSRIQDTERLYRELKDIYSLITGMPYARPEPQAAADTADSMNNRALSFLDMGKADAAERIWEEAVRKDNSNFRCHYNLAVHLWQANRISAEELRKRITEREEDSNEYRKAETDTRFAVLETVQDIRRRISDTGIQEPLPEEPFYAIPRNRREIREGYDLNDFECRLSDGNKYIDDSISGRRRLGIDAASKSYFLEDGTDRTCFRTFLNEYIEDRDNLTAKRFVDPEGEIIADQSNYGIYFFNAATGRSLLSYHLKLDSEGDEIFEYVTRFSANGFVNIAERRRDGWWLKLPPAEPELTYTLSRIASFSERTEAMKRLIRVLPEAEKAYGEGKYEYVRDLLEPSCEDGTLLLYEPALSLWEKLFAWFEAEKLITVIPAEPAGAPAGRWVPGGGDPEEPEGEYTENSAEDEYTRLSCTYTYFTKENYSNSMDVDIFYTVHASDAVSGRPFYTFSFQESETDDHIFSYSEWFKLRGQYLWIKKPEEKKPWYLDLADPAVQRKRDLAVALPGGGVLKNADGMVHIGDFVFEDVYEGLELLSDRQVIHCRDHSYRLICKYGQRREKEAGLWADYAAAHPAVPAEKDAGPKAVRNEDIRKEDIPQAVSEAYACAEGRAWRVRETDSGKETEMRRYDPEQFENGSLSREEVREGAERWIRTGKQDNILTCYECRDVLGSPALSCEWTGGRKLPEMIADGSLYQGGGEEVRKRIIRIALDTAQGLRYGHMKGITHSQVRTDHVIITPEGNAKLDRYGMAAASPNQRTGDIRDWGQAVLEMYAGKELPYIVGNRKILDAFAQCRMIPPEGMKALITDCLSFQVSSAAYICGKCEEELEKTDDRPEKQDTPPAAPQEPQKEPAAAPAEKPGFFSRLRLKRECRKGNHRWNGCVCSVCGMEKHDYELIRVDTIPNGGCCWSVSDPCTGPNCGTPCDSYYPGREGKSVAEYRCRRCGKVIREE